MKKPKNPFSKKRFLFRACLLVGIGFFLSLNESYSKETDQYYVLGKKLKDSGAAVNRYVNDGIKKVLLEINSSRSPDRFACEEVASEVFNSFRYPLVQKIESWAENSGEVDLSPPPNTPWLDFFQKSIYGNDSFFRAPFWQPLSATMVVEGVTFGTDKLGHFISLGEKYYQEYYGSLQEGLSERDALLEALLYGIETEQGWLGKKVLKVFSRADLEANYRGFRYRRSLCKTHEPLLEYVGNQWVFKNEFRIQDHVNPLWDESFYPSYFVETTWERVIRPNVSRYCHPSYWDNYRARQKKYAAMLEGFQSFSNRLLSELTQEGLLPDPAPFSLEAVCQKAKTWN